MRGAIRDFLEATTPYKVCDPVDHGVSAIHKATERCCDLILLNLMEPLQDMQVMVSLLRSKLPNAKIVGFSTLALDLENWSTPTAFDAVIAKQDGLSKLVEILKALTPEPARG